MTALWAVLGLVAVVAGLLVMARRQGAVAATQGALVQAQAQTIKNQKDSEEINASVNADPDIVARASRWVRPVDPK